MGQKLSDLKGIFSAMENKENSNCYERQNCRSDGIRACDTNTPEQDPNCQTNGNVIQGEGFDEHFESIYSNGTETGRVEETNGNSLGKGACVSTSLCSCHNTEDCFCVKTQIDLPQRKNEEDSMPSVSSFRHNSARTLSFVSGKRSRNKSLRSSKDLSSCNSKKKRHNWVLKFSCARLKGGSACGNGSVETDIPEPNVGCDTCVCTGYRRTEEHHLGAGVVFEAASNPKQIDSNQLNEMKTSDEASAAINAVVADQLIDMTKFNPDDYPIEDCDERARIERAIEIAEGVDPPPGFCPGKHLQLMYSELTIDNLAALFQSHLGIPSAALTALQQLDVAIPPAVPRVVHTQVDYIHCLVPDLLQITSCSFYWGKMDRYEAERLLEGRPEGTFLLRDSAQEEYLFSVSFRKYGRSLHARIEQWNHHFSFDSHDPGVFASPTVCGLIEHYKDPTCCMFFEPMLTIPLHRNFAFPLQHLCRAVVCSRVSYDDVNKLLLPKALKLYLKEYHYKQRVRVRRFDLEH